MRAVGEAAYALFAVVWGLTLVLGPGLFQPLEQELCRATAERASRGEGSGPVLRRAAAAGLVGVGGLAVALPLAWIGGLHRLLDENVLMATALLGALAGYAAIALVRGMLAGNHAFGRYGTTLAVEGLGRLALALGLLLIGVRSVTWFGFASGGAFVIAALLGARKVLAVPGPKAEWTELTPALGTLLVMSLAEAFLLNIGPLIVKVLSDDPETPGRFLNALIVARLPLFLFVAVRVTLLPNLARLAGRGEWLAFARLLRNLVLALSAVVLAVTGAAAAVGPSLVNLLFGTRIGTRDMALLAAANGISMIVLSLSLSLVAIGRAALASAGWCVGVIAFMLALPFGSDPFLRVETASLVAMFTSAAVLAAAVQRSLPDRQTRRFTKSV